MKTIFLLFIIIALVSCSSYSFSIGKECDNSRCPLTSWAFNNTDYSFRCPKQGQFKSSFRLTSTGYIYDFMAQNNHTLFSIPLKYNQNVRINGLQYIGSMNNNTHMVILNCTYPISKQYSPLCNIHELVGGKIVNNTFQPDCAYGLDKPDRPYIESEILPDI